MWKKNKPKIEFLSNIEYLKDIEEIRPAPSSKFLPEWWKKIPYDTAIEKNRYKALSMTARRCPSFVDYFSSGYILPMWADTTLYFNSQTKEWKWQCGNLINSKFRIQFFDPSRFQDYGHTNFYEKKSVAVWQFINPWTIVASPGYFVLQLPLLFHESSDFAAFPGMYDPYAINTDKLEIAIFEADKEIFIKRGTPLVQYVLIKKENFDLIIRDKNDKDLAFEERKKTLKSTSFGTVYNQLKGKNF